MTAKKNLRKSQSAKTAQAQRILIVDDEHPMVEALTLKLSHQGFDTAAAYDGQEALEKLGKESFQLILLDIVMPKKDGFAVLEHLKKNAIKIPVLVLTNLGQEEDRDRCTNFGAREYLIKADTPIITILEHIRNILS